AAAGWSGRPAAARCRRRGSRGRPPALGRPGLGRPRTPDPAGSRSEHRRDAARRRVPTMDLTRFIDKHVHRLTNHALVHRIRWKARYLKWLLAGSGPYSDEYVEQVTASIAAGNRHGTLSVVLHDPEGARREADFVAETVRELGLEPSDVCIEYGCGALRIGEPIMKLLEPGNYIGLDVTDRFWKNGIQRLG